MLIQRVYQVDPLVCPKCGGTMKIISFVEARQNEVIRKILEHCGLCTVKLDPDYREHLRRESQVEQLDLPWEP